MKRREVIAMLGAAALPAYGKEEGETLIATNTYPWQKFYGREGRKFVAHSEELLGEIAKTGLTGYESIVKTNPSPSKWGGKEATSDAQLKLQAQALDELGGALLEEGMTLAYHTWEKRESSPI